MDLVFISHVAEDSALAVQLAHGLERTGFATWYYERDSLPGPSYLDQILAALARTSAVVILVSPAALTSWQVDKEVVQAHERGLPFLPLVHGLTHEQVRAARPAWAMAFGAAVSLPLPDGDVTPLLPRIVAGLRWLTTAATTTGVAPPPTPVPAPSPGAARVAPPFAPLPAPSSPLLGRAREVAQLTALLRQPAVRLVTLTGPGGTGKTRLALQVAADLAADFPDGVAFVDLAPLSDPNLVLPTIARALGVREDGGQSVREAVRAALQATRVLHLLDNVEQVVAAVPVVADLLADCPGLRVLATSRTPLHLRGEHEIATQPLAVPDLAHLPGVEDLAQVGSVALFLARAQEVKAGFALTDANSAAIAAICARLDGLPLAIELAAARVKLLAPQALLDRLGNRLKLLTVGARDLPARQQTLRGTIDWSYGLLEAAERALFARASVFVGGWTLAALEDVCDTGAGPEIDVLSALAALVDWNMVCQNEQADGEPRFTMLETIREYAMERLAERGEEAVYQAAHATYFLALAETAAPELKGSARHMWLSRLDLEHDNLRAALRWSIDTAAADVGLRLAAALWRFWYIHGHMREGRRWLADALALPGAAQVPVTTRAEAINGAGALAHAQDDCEFAATLYEESLALRRASSDDAGAAGSLLNLGNLAIDQGDYARATSLLEESLALRRKLGDQWGVAAALNSLGEIARSQGASARALTLFETSLSLRRQIGDQRGIAMTLNNLGSAALAHEDLARARAAHDEGLTLYRALGDQQGVATTLSYLARVLLAEQDWAGARALWRESLDLYQQLGNRQGLIEVLEGLAAVACRGEQYPDGVRLYGVADRARATFGLPLPPVAEVERGRDLAAARQALDPAAYQASFEGQGDLSPSLALPAALRDYLPS